MELANDEEKDGIKYRVYLKMPDWVVEIIHPDGRRLEECFRVGYEPRFGPDGADISRAEEIMEKLITQMRASS